MKIIVFADVHYYAGDMETAIFDTKKKLVKYSLPFLDKLTEKINCEYHPDLAVNLGDLIQDTTEHGGDVLALRFMFERLKRIYAPTVSVLGNHDLKMMDSVEEVEAIMGEKSTCAFDLNGWHLVFLTTEVRCELGTARGGCYKAQYLARETIDWLREDLMKNTLPSLIFTHYALAEDDSINDECMFMKNRDEVKEIIRRHGNVKGVFYGHQHRTKTSVEDGIPHYGVGSPIADADMTGSPDGVYLEINLEKEDYKVTTHFITKEELSL